ncbi:hypothetical protein BaRGS_00011693, partial [Batillaria attramentaria]
IPEYHLTVDLTSSKTTGKFADRATWRKSMTHKATTAAEEPDDPKHNCPQFVVENATLTCRCTPSSDKPGKPAPNLVWRGYSNTNDLMIPSVQRRDGNTTYTYGPSRVVISNTSGFVSTRSGFLFCRADDVNPAARYSWSGVTCSADSGPDDGSMCSFIPRPEDGGNVVTCTATNTASETLSGSVTQTIDVNCLPKLNEDSQYLGSPSNPVLLNITDAVFSLLAFPEPEAHDIVYLGPTPPDPSLTNAEQKSTALLVECRNDVTTLYMSICTVSASNAVKGFYRLTLTNLFGSVDVFVKLEQTIGAEPAQAVPMSAIGSVVGATVLIIIVITVAFLVIAAWRRKKKPDQSGGIREKKEDEETGRRTSEVHACGHNFGADPKKRYKKQTKHAKSNSLKRPQADELTDTQTAEAQTEPTENKSPPSVDLETNKASASLAAGSSKSETAEAPRADAISEMNRVEEERNDDEAGYSTLSFTGEPQPLIALSREGSTSNVGKGLVYEDPYSTVEESDQHCGANLNTRTDFGSQDGNTHDDECSEKVQSNGDVGEVGNAAVGNTKRVEHTPDNTDFTTTVPAESPYSSDGDVYAQVNKLHKEGSSAENSSSQVQENQGVTRSASEDKDQVQNIRSTGDDNTNIGQFSSDTPPSSPS